MKSLTRAALNRGRGGFKHFPSITDALPVCDRKLAFSVRKLLDEKVEEIEEAKKHSALPSHPPDAIRRVGIVGTPVFRETTETAVHGQVSHGHKNARGHTLSR